MTELVYILIPSLFPPIPSHPIPSIPCYPRPVVALIDELCFCVSGVYEAAQNKPPKKTANNTIRKMVRLVFFACVKEDEVGGIYRVLDFYVSVCVCSFPHSLIR